MLKNRLFWAGLIGLLLVLVFWFDLNQLITLDNFKARQAELSDWVSANPLMAALSFFGAYVAVTAASIPGAAAMTLVAGALFGFLWGTVLVSFASTIGATLAFLVSRYLFRDLVESRFAKFVERINKGIEKEGAFYLLGLRLIPAIPFFVINAVMGLTRMKLPVYYGVSQLGMLPATAVYVNAGTQLAQVESTSDIFSPALIGSFVLLGLFPLIARRIMDRIKANQVYKGYSKPTGFDTNMVVIGAGSAGLVTSYIAAAARAKVTLIERENMGGDCLNTGCVPSKALLRSAKIRHYFERANEFGLNVNEGAVKVDFPAVMQRVQDVIAKIEPHDSVERYTELGVDCVAGEATISSPWTVEVNGRTIRTANIVIATGGRPFVPPIPGLDGIDYLTSDNLWELKEAPGHLLVLGGGAIGCELAQAFKRLGSEVTQVEMLPRLMANEDPEVSAELLKSFSADGVRVLTDTKASRFESTSQGDAVICESQAGEERIAFDKVLVATGRRGGTENLGLAELGIETARNGTVPVNEYLQTRFPNIYACGDVAGPYQLTHAAAHQAWYCAMNALYGRFWRFAVDYSVLPRAVFCDPEVASVGLNEQSATEQGIEYEITTYGIDDLDRAIADGEARGFVKVLTPPGRDKILGAVIVGPHAGDILSEYVLAMRHGLGLAKILGTIHTYPTLAEANKFAAGNWRKANLSERLLRLSGWLNQRSRG